MASFTIGAVGSGVAELQAYLLEVSRRHYREDFDPGVADGKFGPSTLTAVKNFQAAIGLPVTGIVDGNVSGALMAAANSQYGTISWMTAPGPKPSTAQNIRIVQPQPMKPVAGAPMMASTFGGLDWKTIGIIVALGIAIMMFLKNK